MAKKYLSLDRLTEYDALIKADYEQKITDAVSGKASSSHTHDDRYYTETEIDTKLKEKADLSHGTHVTFDSTNKPKMDDTAAFGTSTNVARADHVHPTDTSRASKTEFDTHTSNATVHITSTERSNWNAAKTHADSAHAPSNAEKNQNAFSNIKVGTTTVSADTTTDTLELVGSNVTITPDATNDKVTFTVASGSTSAAGIVKLTDSTSSTSTTTAATPKNVKAAYDLANAAKTAAENAQTTADGKAASSHSHSDATTSAAGFMTAAMVTKLNGIATGANKTTVDTALSSTSTNPVQNKVVNDAISSLTSTVSTNTSSISSHTTAISNLQTAVAEFQEITSAEIQALFSA